MIERNKPGKGRKNRVNVSLPSDYNVKLNRLAIACGNIAPTTLAYELIKYCLDEPQIVANLQETYAAHDDYRVILVRSENGGWKYEVLRHIERRIL